MDALDTIKQTEQGDEYLTWKANNPAAYLTSAFSMASQNEQRKWLISYYDPEQDRLTSFSEGAMQQAEAFKPQRSIEELNINEVKITEKKALVTATKTLTEHNDAAEKTIMVLQQFGTAPIWNITFVTTQLRVINVKISAETGEEISQSVSSITDFMQRQE